jgi:hypothetical protein
MGGAFMRPLSPSSLYSVFLNGENRKSWDGGGFQLFNRFKGKYLVKSSAFHVCTPQNRGYRTSVLPFWRKSGDTLDILSGVTGGGCLSIRRNTGNACRAARDRTAIFASGGDATRQGLIT